MKLKRAVYPLNWNGFERTYREVVKVENGICEPKLDSTAAFLVQCKGYEVIPEEGQKKEELPQPPPTQTAGQSVSAPETEAVPETEAAPKTEEKQEEAPKQEKKKAPAKKAPAKKKTAKKKTARKRTT